MGTIVQSISARNDAAGTSLGVAQASNPTAGNFLWVIASSADATMTVADSQGHTFTERGTVIEAGIPTRLRHFTAPITSSGANTVTATFGASVARRGILVVEISGVSAWDVQDTQTDTGNNPTDAATVSNTAQPAIGLAYCIDLQGGSPGVGTGYTSGGQFDTYGSATGGRLEYKAITSVASQSANFVNATFSRTITAFAIFTDGGGGGGSTILRQMMAHHGG